MNKVNDFSSRSSSLGHNDDLDDAGKSLVQKEQVATLLMTHPDKFESKGSLRVKFGMPEKNIEEETKACNDISQKLSTFKLSSSVSSDIGKLNSLLTRSTSALNDLQTDDNYNITDHVPQASMDAVKSVRKNILGVQNTINALLEKNSQMGGFAKLMSPGTLESRQDQILKLQDKFNKLTYRLNRLIK